MAWFGLLAVGPEMVLPYGVSATAWTLLIWYCTRIAKDRDDGYAARTEAAEKERTRSIAALAEATEQHRNELAEVRKSHRDEIREMEAKVIRMERALALLLRLVDGDVRDQVVAALWPMPGDGERGEVSDG